MEVAYDMDMFIGRERELNALEKLYTSNKFEFVVIYGRRRVGKQNPPSSLFRRHWNMYLSWQKRSG